MNEPRIAFVGEAWGEQEELVQAPFMGPSGRFFNYVLSLASLRREDCLITNVFNLRPQNNDLKSLCGTKAEAIANLPMLAKGQYIRAEYAPELARLFSELEAFRPNCIVALGATAAWALLGTSGIRKIRGAPTQGLKGYKVIPTYHPAAILRQYNLFPVLVADVQKAAREGLTPELTRPNRFIHVEPSIEDLYAFERQYIIPSPNLSIDIETHGNQITCIGFAPSSDRAIVIPFVDETKALHNYWATFEEELEAWNWVKRICKLEKKIVGQNFNYDMKFLLSSYGITVPNASDDIMLLHHALQPEMEKSLGFMASIYTNELAWKFMRPKHTVKKED